MPFKCRQCPHREFATRTALQQHYRASIGHHFCHVCDLRFNDQPSFEAHNAATHPEFECTTCKQVFLTQTALEAHYRGKASSIHPNCPRCGKGFLNQRCLSEHQQTAHPTVICTCGVRILEEDLAIHYLNSVMHPSCTKCGIGFKDDAAYDGHGDVVHSDSRCAVCRRQFPNLDELGHHFVSSPDHPNCNKCDTPVGFLDDAALHNHVVAEHTLPPPVRDLLAIQDTPTVSRLTPVALPPPDKKMDELWKSTVNKVVSPKDTGLSVGLLRPTWSKSEIGFPSLRCMLCRRDPCVEPMVTRCGHLFCQKCITKHVVQVPECPKCAEANLLYCLVRLRFDN